MIHDESRYMTRGKFSESRFERQCLAEYAETFKTVCVDAAYYRFPDLRYIEGMVHWTNQVRLASAMGPMRVSFATISRP